MAGARRVTYDALTVFFGGALSLPGESLKLSVRIDSPVGLSLPLYDGPRVILSRSDLVFFFRVFAKYTTNDIIVTDRNVTLYSLHTYVYCTFN